MGANAPISNVINEWSSKVDKIPDIIANRYEPLQRLGQGGMGVVYRVRDRLTGSVVALKQVLVTTGKLQFSISDRSTNETLALALEFRTLATLRHPHIISVQDYGFDGSGHPFFTMEYLPDAQPITDYARGKSFDEQLRLLTEMLQAIAYLHRRGIIHRDIKPGNILVDASGGVKVLDFGLAVERDVDDAVDDRNDQIAGTMAYLAPEVIQGESAGVASDLFAVGVLAYELFAEQHPFNTSRMLTVINDLLYTTPDFERIDDQVMAFVGIMMSKLPEERPAIARDALVKLYAPLSQPLPEETAVIRESFLQASKFVGRSAELAQLTANLKAVKGGTSSGWLIGGESGVGKSRLVDEVRVRALVEGLQVVRGQGVSEGGVPYQLWRGVLRPLVISTDLSNLEASVLKAIVPDIDTLLGQPVTEAEPLEGEANQQRLVFTIVDVLKRQISPTLIILEDLHWADE
ncbi:MAG: serine/threonine-protein kinase, partial [Chloroflexota bacterium]